MLGLEITVIFIDNNQIIMAGSECFENQSTSYGNFSLCMFGYMIGIVKREFSQGKRDFGKNLNNWLFQNKIDFVQFI